MSAGTRYRNIHILRCSEDRALLLSRNAIGGKLNYDQHGVTVKRNLFAFGTDFFSSPNLINNL